MSRDGPEEDDDDEAGAGPSVVRKAQKANLSNPLVQSTGLSLAKKRRLAAEQQAEEDALDNELEDEYASVSVRVKAGTGSSGGTKLGGGRDDAVREVDWYDEDEKQRRGAGGAPDGAEESTGAKPSNDDGIYRGLNSYSSALPQSSKPNKFAQRGPIKAPTNIRTVTVVDYQPDVCKDYKETGYCGFGDTCKFLHDRSDYLAGWQMEASYLPNSNARDLGAPKDASEEEEEVPFACLICRQPFTDPVQTKCGHYFCSACAIKRFSKTPKCFACGAQTGGIFNSASKIIQRMEKRRRAKQEEREEVRKGWGEVDDGAENGGEILEGVEVGGDD